MEPIRPKRPIVDRKKMQEALRRGVQDTIVEGQRYMAEYPVAKSSYRRTGTLKRSWNYKLTATNAKIEGTVGSAGTIAPYNWVVQGKTQKASLRRGGWRNTEMLKARLGPLLVENLLRSIKDAVA